MSSLPFTLRQLEIFQTLYDTGSFGLSADEHGISQAAISNHIKALETQLGFALFVRKAGKKPVATLEGQAFARDMVPFMKAAHNLAQYRRKVSDRSGASLYRVFVGKVLFERFVRPKLDRFYAENPGTAIEFSAEIVSSDKVMSTYLDKFSFGLFYVKPDISLDSNCRVIAEKPAGIFCHKKLLPKPIETLTAEDINSLPFALWGYEKKSIVNHINELSTMNIYPNNIVARPQFYEVLVKMIESGQAAGFICEGFIDSKARKNLRLIKSHQSWRLVIRRTQGHHDPRADKVEEFITKSVLST